MAFVLAQSTAPTKKQNDIDLTKLQLAVIQQSLQMYRIHCDAYPSKKVGLTGLIEAPKTECKGSWRGPYIEAKHLKDTWGNKILYTIDGARKVFGMVSTGPDGKLGNGDDVAYPE